MNTALAFLVGDCPSALRHEATVHRILTRLLAQIQFFTSTRRTEDQLPGLPDASLARARHHIVRVGSVLLENVEDVTVWFISHGDGNESASSI